MRGDTSIRWPSSTATAWPRCWQTGRCSRGKPPMNMVGGPKQVADKLEEWFVGGACDGFVIGACVIPGSYADFVQHVVPELQRRGLFRKDYAGRTLRDHLGLTRATRGDWRPRMAAE